MHIEIAIPHRGPGLAPSIPYRKSTPITVTINRDPLDLPGPVQIEVINSSNDNGSAILEGAVSLDETAQIQLRGNSQTRPSHSGQLRIRARFQDLTVDSQGFSVCAHPCAVTNGPECHAEYYPYPEPTNSQMGMQVEIGFLSDSGVLADLDQVDEMEIVGPTVERSGSLQGHPKKEPKVQKEMQPLLEVDKDDHTSNITMWNAIAENVLQGQQGSWANDQFDEFKCRRCADAPALAAVIPNSGYRVLRSVFINDQGQLLHRVVKISRPCIIGDRDSAGGPSDPLTVEMHVPPSGQNDGFEFP
ncbi:hypothetical protein [Singulisphaera sp. PoT]|uniref:hypothetical protein n=1 Tax=Singulisphaera sp. PoT TaxID=3411797 RepID=UPI003BF4CB81